MTQLPDALRAAVEQALEGVALNDLTAAAKTLSDRYRGEVRDGRRHLDDDLASLAYLAVRMPATYGAVSAAMAAVGEAAPGFAPRALLDVGAGPGTALWAAKAAWPSLQSAVLVEASGAIRARGEALAAGSGVAAVAWRSADLEGGLEAEPADLVSAAYVLNELSEGVRDALVERLWALTTGVLLIVEPGTPAGWARLMAARGRLIGLGARLIAPCPHALDCPLTTPDWCRFSARVARSRLHRLAKGGEAGWEDESFAYLAVGRGSVPPPGGRVLAEPRMGKGRIELKLCRPDGTAGTRLVTRREGDAFKAARRTDWGAVLKA